MRNQPSPLYAALSYAGHGMPVVALHTPRKDGRCTCGHADCDKPGKHPRWHADLLARGLHDATTDAARIRHWWRLWPGANVGIATGITTDVCDVDSEEGLQALYDLLGEDSITAPTVRTGSGNWHIYFAPTGVGNRVGFLPGVDWRGANGLITAPPSMHASGERYQWSRKLSLPLPPCPPPLREALTPRENDKPAEATPGKVRNLTRYAQAALDDEVHNILTAPRPSGHGADKTPGGRNHALNQAAFSLAQLVAGGVLDEATVVTALTDAAYSAGLPAREIRNTIASGMKAGLLKPRTPA